MATAPIYLVEERENAITTQPANAGSAASPRRFYRPELDVLRFLAFLAVFLHHGVFTFAPTFSRFGAFGLSLFFMLSAFLITELLQREKSANGFISIRSFYVRRSLRIWPLYYGFLLFTLLIGGLFPSHRAPWAFIISFVLMCGNVYIGRNGYPNSSADFLWSISVEEQFYLFWPLLNARCSRRTLSWIALCALPIGSLAVVYMARHSISNLAVWTNAPVQFQIFAWGVLLSLSLRGAIPRLSISARVPLLMAGVSLWLVAARWSGVDDPILRSVTWLTMGYHIVGLGCALIFLSFYGLKADRLPRVLVYLGKISYGLYVFHQFALECASWLLNRTSFADSATHHRVYGVGHISLGFLLTVIASSLSYRYFETPFLRMKDRFAKVRSRPA